MNPGPVEEVGKATNTFMRIMQQQPLSLALVVMNLVLMLLLYYFITKSVDLRSHDLDLIFRMQSEVQQLLAKCIVPHG